MEKFTTHTSQAIPLNIANVDTDQIIPARFLKATDKKGFGDNVFRDWRFDKLGNPNSEFTLNNARYSGSILIAGDNFGCGSSREHAAWALVGFGFKVIVSCFFVGANSTSRNYGTFSAFRTRMIQNECRITRKLLLIL